MPILFALVGATGIGKSKLSIELAEHYDAEIIGVDSRQIYKDFAIGTAQPSCSDMDKVPHHLVNFLMPTQTYSAGDFCRDVKKILCDTPQKNFILVGGTGLYLQALMLGLPQIPKIDKEVRETLLQECESLGARNMFEMAVEVDPEAMTNVDCNNIQRVIRILEVWKATGCKLSEWQKKRLGGIGEIPVFWLDRNRENLYARIDARVDQMIAAGWMNEIHELSQSVPLDAPAWQSLGYRELLSAKNDAEMQAVLADVKKKTRNYAKRQLTWFRWQIKSHSVNLDVIDKPKEYIIGRL